ncbi:flagellar hook-length control protein FliK [Thermodesulfovibrionales bacterium]|nr:flagellar hook-length control protein FliK [Thermodesulfovibrionales bacterium]
MSIAIPYSKIVYEDRDMIISSAQIAISGVNTEAENSAPHQTNQNSIDADSFTAILTAILSGLNIEDSSGIKNLLLKGQNSGLNESLIKGTNELPVASNELKNLLLNNIHNMGLKKGDDELKNSLIKTQNSELYLLPVKGTGELKNPLIKTQNPGIDLLLKKGDGGPKNSLINVKNVELNLSSAAHQLSSAQASVQESGELPIKGIKDSGGSKNPVIHSSLTARHSTLSEGVNNSLLSSTTTAPPQQATYVKSGSAISAIMYASRLGDLGEVMAKMQGAGAKHLTIKLEPPNLGSIHITLRMGKGVLRAAFSVESNVVRDLFSAAIPQIKTSLEGLGIRAGDFSVNTKEDYYSDGRRHHENAHQHQNKREKEPQSQFFEYFA